MKRLFAFLTAVIAVLSLSWPSYAASGTEKGMSHDRAASDTFAGKDLRGLKVLNEEGVVIGNIQDFNIDSRTGMINSVTFKDLHEKNYGLAPAWDKRSSSSSVERMQPAYLENLYDNVGQ